MIRVLLLIAFFVAQLLSPLWAQTKIEKQFYSGNYENALILLNEKMEAGNGNLADFQMAAECWIQQYNYNAALDCLNRALRLDGEDRFLLEKRADVQVKLGMKRAAFDGYTFLLLDDSDNRRIAAKKGDLLMDFKQYRQASQLYYQQFQKDTSNIYLLRKYVISNFKMEDYNTVVGCFKRYPIFSLDDFDMRMVLISTYQKMDENEEAIPLLEQILLVDSLYQPAISKLAYIYFSAYRNYKEGLRYYRQLNQLEHYHDPFHLKNLGICEYFTGNFETSAHLLDSLSEVLNGDPFIPFYAGLSYRKMGNVDKALEYLERASESVIPAYTADLYHHLGRAYAAKRMPHKAIAVYKKVLEYDATNYQVLYDLAVTYDEFKLGSTIALAYYQQFVKECSNLKSADLIYAENRIDRLGETLFFEGKE